MGYSVYPAAAAGLSVRKSQTFTSSGTFTLPSGYGASKPLLVDLEICGGGGGGGGGAYSASAEGRGGGGGGSGVTTVFDRVSLTANATITIGAGGTGGTAGGATGTAGASGGASNVNSTYYSPGGGGGSGAVITASSRYGKMVNTYGYFIPGGYAGSSLGGVGGAGGSGGDASGTLQSNPQNGLYYAGGIYGYPSMRYNDNTDSSTTQLASGADTNDGKGLAMIMSQGNSGTVAIRPLLLQRGGGGGGSSGSSANTYGIGGGAGTKTAGGLQGIRSQTTGNKNGSSATDAGCGGGGGGGSWNSGGAAGAGGNGGAGYITVYWWE